MSTLFLVGRIVRANTAPGDSDSEVVIAAGGHHWDLACCRAFAELANMALDPHDLLAVAVRSGRVLHAELIQQGGPAGGAVLELADSAPAADVQPGLCQRCGESGWVMETPAPLRVEHGPARVLVLPVQPFGGDAA